MDGAAIVIRGDAKSLPLATGSVDLIVTSPPYWTLRNYTDDGGKPLAGQLGAEHTPTEYIAALLECSKEWWRVLKPGGSLFVNLGDKYATAPAGNKAPSGLHQALRPAAANASQIRVPKQSHGVRSKSLCLLPERYAIGMVDGLGDPDGKGWILRAEIVWDKPNSVPESVKDRVRRLHELWFHFTKIPRYYSAVDTIREPHKSDWTAGEKTPAAKARKGDDPTASKDSPLRFPHPLGALPGSVWRIATEPLVLPDELGVAHFAAFPTEWPRRIISAWAPTRGICTVCGKGLRPTVQASTRPATPARIAVELDRNEARGRAPERVGASTIGARHAHPVVIDAWACDCETPGPLRPAIVLDPFGGTATVAAVAKALGCIGISNDLSADYGRVAQYRTAGDGYAKIYDKVHRVKKVRKPTPARKGTQASEAPETLPGI